MKGSLAHYNLNGCIEQYYSKASMAATGHWRWRTVYSRVEEPS
jgi:hypothetical protein